MKLDLTVHTAAVLETRFATSADLPGILKIAESTSALPQWTAAHYEAALNQEPSPTNRRMFVGTAFDNIVAFGVLSVLTVVSPPEGEIENLAVSLQWRRHGYGRAMLGVLLDFARANEAAFVDLEVRAGNVAALALYHASGFVVTGRRPHYYREPIEDAVLLRVHLSGGHEASGMIED